MKIKALHLEDDAADAFFVRRILESHGYELDVAEARTPEEYKAQLERGPVDLIMCDNGLPGFDGARALKLAREKIPNVPFIVVSGSGDQQQAESRMREGASDYVLKNHLWQLPGAVRRALDANTPKDDAARLLEHNRGMARLVSAVQELSVARTLEDIMAVVRRAARELTGCDGATFVLRDVDKCYYADENAISPLWKGQRFPMSACISGWAMLNKQPAIIEDIYADSRIPADAYRPTFVKSLVMVPIRTSEPIGAIGNYWATPHLATKEEVELLHALANTTSVAMENVQVYQELEQRVQDRTVRLEAANRELEAFSYSVSHDLQAPIRAISGFTDILRKSMEDKLDEGTIRFFGKIQGETRRMNDLITDLLRLAKISRIELQQGPVDLSALAHEIIDSLRSSAGDRQVQVRIEEGMIISGDRGLLRVVLENLLSNAWKYSSKNSEAVIEFSKVENPQRPEFCIRDNGAGFDMAFSERLFAPFQRMHTQAEFAGTGVGLATVQRIIHRHGGTLRAEAKVGEGAAFFFTLPAKPTDL